MRAFVLGAALLALTPAAASAQYYYAPQPPPAPQPPRSTYDWQSGNMIRTVPRPEGGANIYGNNVNTGATWQTTIQPNGNQRGTDSQGNSWSYDQRSGAYQNSNGHGCVGQGAARTCW